MSKKFKGKTCAYCSKATATTDDHVFARHAKGERGALKAVALDDTLTEGHVDLGAAYFQYDYDWPAAERELRRAVELNPNYAAAQEFLGWFRFFSAHPLLRPFRKSPS